MDGRGEKSDNVRTAFEALQLGGLDPGAREIRVVVDCKTIRKNNVFETVVLPNVVVLFSICSFPMSDDVCTCVRKIGGFEDDAPADGKRVETCEVRGFEVTLLKRTFPVIYTFKRPRELPNHGS